MNIAKWVLAVWCLLSALLVAQNPPPSGTLQQSRTTPTKAAQNDPRPASVAQQERVLDSYGKLPLTFERNHGQSDPSVKFLSRGSGYTLFLTNNEAVFSLRGSAGAEDGKTFTKKVTKFKEEGAAGARLLPFSSAAASDGFKKRATPEADTAVLRMKLHGANTSAKVTGEDELPGKANYFIGNDPKQWHRSVPTYAKVKYEGVYPGVDLVYYGNQRQLEYDFIVAPGADPRGIQLDVSGAKTVRRDPAGDLVLSMSGGEVRWHKPVVYQEDAGKRRKVAASYVVNHKDEVAFEIGAYDLKKPLFIDPLVYSTYLGGSDVDIGLGIAVDSTGSAYVTGETLSTNFPIGTPLQSLNAGGFDVFVTKLNPDGSALVYSTYLGGSADDFAQAIAVDATGDCYITGTTSSSDFPTANPIQPTYGGNQDAFVSKLDSSGTALIYSTYLGGGDFDSGIGIATDSLGNTFVTGITFSSNFPTMNALQAQYAGNGDIFVTKFDPTGSTLFFSTYLGGSGGESAGGIAVDTTGKVYLTGQTASTDFPTKNALQKSLAGSSDSFVTKVSPLGSTLIYSTYLGGSNDEEGLGIAVDSSGDAYTTGLTFSSDFPLVAAIQPFFGGNEDAYVVELNPSGSALLFSTYLGGSSQDVGYGIALDSMDNVFVVGTTLSPNFPIVNPIKRTKGRGYDIFASQLSPGGAAFVYSTYMGGAGDDVARAVAVDILGNAYLTGSTDSTNFGLANPFQPTYGGGTADAFVSEIQSAQPNATLFPAKLNFGNQTVGTTSNAATINLKNLGELTLLITSIQVTGVDGSDFIQTNNCPSSLAAQASCAISVTFSPPTAGLKSAAITVTDNASDSPQSVPLTGNGALPATTFTPPGLTFPTQLVFTASRPETLDLTNSGLGTLFISNMTFAGPFTQTNNCGTSLPAGATCSFTVTFKPLDRGTLTGSITITDNAPSSPQVVNLTGTGTFIQLIPTSINFGTQPIHSTSLPHKIAVTNKGSVAVSIGSISIVGMNAGDFAQTNNCGTKLDFGATCMITVTFTPTVRGNRSANISITDNGGGSPQKVSLFGVGT